VTKEKKGRVKRKSRTWSDLDEKNAQHISLIARPTGHKHPECYGIMARKKPKTADQHGVMDKSPKSPTYPSTSLGASSNCYAAV
jgi:hypothetical protein